MAPLNQPLFPEGMVHSVGFPMVDFGTLSTCVKMAAPWDAAFTGFLALSAHLCREETSVHAAEFATSLNRLSLRIQLNETIIDEISNYSFLICAFKKI